MNNTYKFIKAPSNELSYLGLTGQKKRKSKSVKGMFESKVS